MTTGADRPVFEFRGNSTEHSETERVTSRLAVKTCTTTIDKFKAMDFSCDSGGLSRLDTAMEITRGDSSKYFLTKARGVTTFVIVRASDPYGGETQECFTIDSKDRAQLCSDATPSPTKTPTIARLPACSGASGACSGHWTVTACGMEPGCIWTGSYSPRSLMGRRDWDYRRDDICAKLATKPIQASTALVMGCYPITDPGTSLYTAHLPVCLAQHTGCKDFAALCEWRAAPTELSTSPPS